MDINLNMDKIKWVKILKPAALPPAATSAKKGSTGSPCYLLRKGQKKKKKENFFSFFSLEFALRRQAIPNFLWSQKIKFTHHPPVLCFRFYYYYFNLIIYYNIIIIIIKKKANLFLAVSFRLRRIDPRLWHSSSIVLSFLCDFVGGENKHWIFLSPASLSASRGICFPISGFLFLRCDFCFRCCLIVSRTGSFWNELNSPSFCFCLFFDSLVEIRVYTLFWVVLCGGYLCGVGGYEAELNGGWRNSSTLAGVRFFFVGGDN